jgi:glycosyltransferase involved in cell wall biosynthesis
MKKHSKICLVIPSLHAGGMERVMTELANFIAAKDKVQVHLVLYGKNPSTFYTLPLNLQLHKPNYTFRESFRFFSTLRALFFLRYKIKHIKPDSILSFGEYWNSFVLISLLGLKYPIYISDRCKPDKEFSTLHTLLRRWLYPKAAGIIAQTSKAREIYSEKFKLRRIIVIGNPIRKIHSSVNIRRENIILTAGRLIQTKNHDRLIKIFSQLSGSDWKLLIIGGNALKQNNLSLLQKFLEDKGLRDNVILAGELTDVDSQYLKSKIFAFTSNSEGFPNVIGEALSAGLPVVSYDCVAGPSEMIVDGENGFLVPVFDDDLFQKRLQQLIDDEELRQKMARKAPESVEKFSIEKIGQQYLDFILS